MDSFAAEEIEKMLARIGEAPREWLVRTDVHGAQARRMLQTMMDAEHSAAAAA